MGLYRLRQNPLLALELFYLPKIISSSKKGDVVLIKEIIKIFRKEGIKIIDSTYFNQELRLKKGNYTKIKPDALSKKDILKGKGIISDLKNANFYVIPLGGKDADKTVDLLTDFSYLVRKALAKKIHMKFLPKISFISDKSFDYAEKIEKLIKESHGYKYGK